MLNEFKKVTNDSRIHVLLNKNVVAYNKARSFIYIAGVGDPYSGYDDVESALKGIEKGSVTILLAHSPQIIDKCKGK